MVATTRFSHLGLVACACLALIARADRAEAGGFQLNEQSARMVATAFAGTAAIAEDGSTVYYNPAGMTLLPNGSLAATLALVDVELTVSGDATTLGDPNVTGPNGSHSANGASTGPAPVPAFNLAQKLPYDLALGIGVVSPFGLKTNYPVDGITRYVATLSELRVINGNIALAWQAPFGLSVGAGFNIAYATADLNQVLPPPLGNNPGLLTGDDVSFGWNLGLLYQIGDTGSRVGVSYRSPISYTLKGDGRINSISGPQEGPIRAGAKTPGFLLVSGVYRLLGKTDDEEERHFPELDILADFAWTDWSTFKVVTIDASSIGIGNVVNRFDFRDGYRGSLGTRWSPDEHWTVRGGLAYDASPVTNSTRTVRLPDADRVLLGIGGGYTFPKGFSIDLAYMHIFVDGGSIDFTSENPDASTFRGKQESTVNLFALQFTYNWDKWPPQIPF